MWPIGHILAQKGYFFFAQLLFCKNVCPLALNTNKSEQQIGTFVPISCLCGSEPNGKTAQKCRFQNGWDMNMVPDNRVGTEPHLDSIVRSSSSFVNAFLSSSRHLSLSRLFDSPISLFHLILLVLHLCTYIVSPSLDPIQTYTALFLFLITYSISILLLFIYKCL